MDRLPNELLSLIFSHLLTSSQPAHTTSTLPAVCRVSSLWQKVGQEILFQRVELIDRMRGYKEQQLAVALEGRPELGKLVLGMELAVMYRETLRVMKLCQNLRSFTVHCGTNLYQDNWIYFLPSTLVRLELQRLYFDEYETPLLPNLTFLQLKNVSLIPSTIFPITKQDIKDPYNVFDRPLPPRPTLPPPNGFPSLRHLSIVDCGGYAPRLLNSPKLNSALIELQPGQPSQEMELFPMLDEAFTKLDALVLSVPCNDFIGDNYAQFRHLLSSPKTLLRLTWVRSSLGTPYANDCFSDVQNVAIGLPKVFPRFREASFSLRGEGAGEMARVADLTFLKELRKIKLVILHPDVAEVNLKEVVNLRARGIRVEVAVEDEVQERFAEIRRSEAERASV